MSTYDNIIAELECLADKDVIECMAKFWVITQRCCGVSIPELRRIARETGWNHDLALRLW